MPRTPFSPARVLHLGEFYEVPKNRQVVPGPVGFEAQGVEIGFECSLLDPSATGGLDVLRVAARTL